MATPSKPSAAAHMAVVYVTLGAILDVWTGIWYVYLTRHGGSDGMFYVCYGLFFTGVVLLVIGLALGRIGRAARRADLPPDGQPGQPTPAQRPVVTAPAPVPGTYVVPQGYLPAVPAAPPAQPVPPVRTLPPTGSAPR